MYQLLYLILRLSPCTLFSLNPASIQRKHWTHFWNPKVYGETFCVHMRDRRLIFLLPDCDWNEGQYTHLVWTFLFMVFQFKYPATLPQFLPFSFISFCSLCYVQFALFSHNLWWCHHKQQGWGSHSRVAEDPKCSWDALLHFWASRHSITSQKTSVLLPVPHSQVFQLTQDPVLVWVHFYYVFQVIHKY